MNRYTLFFFALLACASMAAHAQTPPTPGLGCTPGMHTFCVTSTANSGTGTLRQALLDSDTAGGANMIGFAIAGTGPQTITLTSQLPAINTSGTVTSLLIDGYSQPGSALNTNTPDQGGLNARLMIEIAGTGGFYGLFYNCCGFTGMINLTYQGLAMHGFLYMIAGQSNGLTPKAQINVYGNFLGTTIGGTALPPGSGNFDAVLIQYDDAQVGGTQPWQRNLISGVLTGISAGTPNDSVVIEGNLIGTDASGTQAIANNIGVDIGSSASGIRIGCTGAGCTAAGHPSRNVISGNNLGLRIGVASGPGTSSLELKGNNIGTDWSGAMALPNGYNGCPANCGGIWVQQGGTVPQPVVVGGFAAGEANIIAWNNGPGINGPDGRVSESFDNRGNAIHNNGGTDIAFSLAATRIPNDPGDPDTGTNNQQNYPQIQSANLSGTPGNLTLNVTYLVDSTTGNSTYPLRVDFYVDIDEGSGEYLVSDSYPASSAQAERTVSLPLPADVQTLVGFVASATDANGYSSELSPSVVFDRIFANEFESP